MDQTNVEILNRNQQRVSKFITSCIVFGVVILLTLNFKEQNCLDKYLSCQNQQWLPATNLENWQHLDLVKRFEVENVGTRYHWLFWS